MKAEQFNEKTWEILKKIKAKILLQESLEIIWKHPKDEDDFFDYEKDEENALAELKDSGAIEIYKESVDKEKMKVFAGSVTSYKYTNSPDHQKDTFKMNLVLKIIRSKFDEVYKEYEENSNKKISQNILSLKSLYLITRSLECFNTIFLVLDEHFEFPDRCEIKKGNESVTYIKKLYDVAYFVDAPGKRVDYDKNLADNINNGLFKRKSVASYIKTNKFSKPTLVQKSNNNTLVLKNEIIVKTGLIKNIVPVQYQSLYIDKTR